jgi:16S rRNA (guanine527-N7)-methyltransferase
MAGMGRSTASSAADLEGLKALGRRFGRELDGPTLERLVRYVDLLHTWNARINLTGARTPEAIVQEQLPDSFALAQLVPPGVSLVDVGSGGGLPALPFAVLRADVRLTLTEPRSRRRAFLATALRELKVAAELRPDRAEDLQGGSFDSASARAVLPPAEWWKVGQRLVVPGGTVYFFLGTEATWVPPAHSLTISSPAYEAGPRCHRVMAVAASTDVPRGT